MPNLVDCFMASDTIEAKFIADQLMARHPCDRRQVRGGERFLPTLTQVK